MFTYHTHTHAERERETEKEREMSLDYGLPCLQKWELELAAHTQITYESEGKMNRESLASATKTTAPTLAILHCCPPSVAETPSWLMPPVWAFWPQVSGGPRVG